MTIDSTGRNENGYGFIAPFPQPSFQTVKRICSVAPQPEHRYFQQIEQMLRRRAHRSMLGLVGHARLSAPPDHPNRRNGVHRGVAHRQIRVDGVGQTGVLHVNQRALSCRQVVTGGQRHRRALVRCDDVLNGSAIVELVA